MLRVVTAVWVDLATLGEDPKGMVMPLARWPMSSGVYNGSGFWRSAASVLEVSCPSSFPCFSRAAIVIVKTRTDFLCAFLQDVYAY
jgi:hypothetical protein